MIRVWRPSAWSAMVLVAVLSGCTPTRSTIGGYTSEELAKVAQEARNDCETRRGASNVPPNPFTTDGCSVCPDGTWQKCCVDHDKWYWCGGSAEDRKTADGELRACVARESENIGRVMWVGVRLGGVPWLPFPWRWGYGWPWPRGYEKTR